MNARINKIVTGAATVAVAVIPGLAFAQNANQQTTAGTANTTTGIGGVLHTVSDLIGLIIPIVLALAIVYFMIGVLKYVMNAGEKQDEARKQMLWGIIAIAVMVSIWGLVGILQSTFNIGNSQAPQNLQFIPTVQNPSSN